ncbi:MAG: carboxypeptidase-like regulatory domain-containing protein [Flavobacteriia bacterium]|nr:carboxypeptidase-like regulatory domain-containing protein [Flavobacteriia bacterium]
MLFRIVISFLLFFTFNKSFGQILKGKITDNLGVEIPFAKIRIENTGYGTVANADGNYQLEMNKGLFVVVFSASGYENKWDTIQINEGVNDWNVLLIEVSNLLDEVVIKEGTAKNRGKEIMKKVIDKRAYFNDLVQEYSCETYCFASLEKDNLDSLKKDSIIGKEKLNLLEWRANSFYQKSGKFKDEFIAYNDFTDANKNLVSESVSVGVNIEIGEANIVSQSSISSNPYLFVNGIKEAHFSIFENTIDAPKICQNPIISPMAYNALLYYNFYLERSFYDSLNQLNYEILVKPRFDYEALFEGTIFLRDSSWELISYDLGINPGVLLFFKDLRIIADYKKEGERLISDRKEFIYTIKEGKNKINGQIRISQKKYQFNLGELKSKFWLESSVYKPDAFDKDTAYWNANRPFTLKDFEQKFVNEQDSIINYHESEAYLKYSDSVRNRISFLTLTMNGYFHVNSFKKQEFSVNGLLTQIIPFGVGGYRHRLMISYKKEFKNGKIITISPDIDYGFYNKDVKGSFDGSIMFNPLNFSKIGFQIGDVYDFVSSSQNIQSTLAPSNRVRNQKMEVRFSRELMNGLYFRSSFLYSDRSSIDSMKYPSWVQVFGKFQQPQSFEGYKIFMPTLELEYHIRQKFMIRKGKKYVLGSPWPTFNLMYKKGIPNVFATQSNFDFIEFKITDEIKLNSFGNAEIRFVAGSFIYKKDLRLIEYKYFRPSDQYYFSNPINSLQRLDTALKTANSYLQINFIHHFNGFFLNKIWLINRLKLEETIGGSVLTIPDAKFFQVEFYVGIERKIRIKRSLFKLGIYAVSQGNTFTKSSINFKIGINNYNASTDKWDY